MTTFCQRLKTLRENAGFSQKQMSVVIGYSQSAVAHWETGKAEPPTAVLIRIAEYFHTTVDYLVGATDERDLPQRNPPLPDNCIEVSPFEREVLLKYRILPPSEQIYVCRMLQLEHPATRRVAIKQA